MSDDAQRELGEHIDAVMISGLAREIAVAGAQEFGNQDPAYDADIQGDTRKTIHALQADPAYRRRYDDFVGAMVYGKSVEFDTTLGTAVALAEKSIQRGKAGRPDMRKTITARTASGGSHWHFADEEAGGLLCKHATPAPAVSADQLNTVQD